MSLEDGIQIYNNKHGDGHWSVERTIVLQSVPQNSVSIVYNLYY